MKFRTDINGLRALAVIAVVLFHFNPSWVPGGFAGVDVFFVISGFLMTGIIFRGLESNNFSIINFYVARANRIIPALSIVCLALLVFGWFYLTPLDYRALGKHVASSMGFLSNVIYWQESGYFDASSHGKWLLHTWSLSVEWQFYMIYPVVLVLLKKCMSLTNIKRLLVVGTVIGFIFSAYATYRWPNLAYFLLPTRAWEMMIGGLAFLYPLQNLKETSKKYLEWVGIALILASYAFISKDNLWPGYLALIPVLGAYLVIIANRSGSVITDNVVMQKVGLWSYSIYLWHWPVVVFGYYLDIYIWPWIGIVLSVILGFLSYKYIEKIKFSRKVNFSIGNILKNKLIWMTGIIAVFSCLIYVNNGFLFRLTSDANKIANDIKFSPYRYCADLEYHTPEKACNYFYKKPSWAVIGDSHSIELSYALANKIKINDEGIKEFSFHGCRPSYKEGKMIDSCSIWTDKVIEYIIKNKEIKNVVVIYRYSKYLEDKKYNVFESFDKMILDLAGNKNKVYIIKPIPNLDKGINKLFYQSFWTGRGIENIKGSTIYSYKKENRKILNHFMNVKYPENVIFIDPIDSFCDDKNCYAIKNGEALYFDDNHPSVVGAEKIVDKFKIREGS
ncbi:acyltransferase family protein [Photobacterium leiognathi]|uniref:acyltransferase family protein n=1 Tax=Photobacterium leiognathi TaxID=553611 RepID=UPI0029821A62|nr:acyltransferase family protein [Photobacterium leiognathi]